MTEARVDIRARDRATGVINKVQSRLGLINKEGIAMGVTFAGI